MKEAEFASITKRSGSILDASTNPVSLAARGRRPALYLLPPAAKGVSEAEHDDAENPQRAFDLAPPVKRQFAGDDFDELKICVRSRREEGRVPPPSRDDNAESADERSALECAAAGCSPDEHHVSLHEKMFPSVGAPASANAACCRPRITRSRGP